MTEPGTMQSEAIRKWQAKVSADIERWERIRSKEAVSGYTGTHGEDTWLLRAQCAFCHTQSLVVAIIKEERKPEVVTDLTRAEILRFHASSLVGEDDVLDMHRFLREFDGDFAAFFGERR